MIASEIYSLFVFALVVGMGVLSHYFLHRMDAKPLTIEQEVTFGWQFNFFPFFTTFRVSYQEQNAGRFIAERAYRNLKVLNDFGNLCTFARP
jgi:hypothetical protein